MLCQIRKIFNTIKICLGVCAEAEAGAGQGDPGQDHPLPLQPDQGHPGATGECGDQSEASIVNINQSEASFIITFQSVASILNVNPSGEAHVWVGSVVHSPHQPDELCGQSEAGSVP